MRFNSDIDNDLTSSKILNLKAETDTVSTTSNSQLLGIEQQAPSFKFDEIEISFRAFIPSPLVALGDIIGQFTSVFSGDNRGFQYVGGRERSRAFQSVVVTVDPQRSSPIINVPERSWGQTTKYDSSQARFDPEKPDWWWIPKVGAKPSAKETLQVTDDNNRISAKRISANEIEINFHLDGGNPLAPIGTPNINADLKVVIRQAEGKQAEYKIKGDHDGFPAYELYINRNRVYEHDPVERNQGPFSLFAPAEFNLETEFQPVLPTASVITGKAVNESNNFNPANSPSHRRLLAEIYPSEVFQALAAAEAKLQSIGRGKIFGGKGFPDYVYDNYSVIVEKMPLGITPEAFLLELLKDLNGTVKNKTFDDLNEFTRRSKDTPKIGDIYDIDIEGPDNGSVVLTGLTNSYFIFSTIETKLSETGKHPEYGSREFGFERNADGTITFYTRGASRPGDFLIEHIGARKQAQSWNSLIAGIKAGIEQRGGQVRSVPKPERYVIPADSPLNIPSNTVQLQFYNQSDTSTLGPDITDVSFLIEATANPNQFLYRIDYQDLAATDASIKTLTGKTDDAGNFSVPLPKAIEYIITLYNPTTGKHGSLTGQIPFDGSTNGITVNVASPDEEDLDNDGLGSYAEYVVGTSATDSDTDNDNINDNVEVSQGTDPLPIAAEVNLDLDTLTQGLDALLRQFQSKLNEEVFGAQNLPNKGVLQGLPLLGDTLKTASGTQFIQQFSNQIRDKLIEKLGNAEQATLEQIRDVLFELFGPSGLQLLKDSDDPGDQITKEDILYILDGSEARFNFDLGGKNTIADLSLPSEIGLPGLGFKFSDPSNPAVTSPKANVALDYTLRFGFGVDVDKKEFFFDTSPTKDLSLSLTPSFPNATATLGFLQVNAANKNSQLDFSIDLDDGEDGNNRLTSSELPNLRLTTDGSADIKLRFDASLSGSTVLPSISSDFNLDWDFVKDGTAPTVNFENVELKLGTFFKNFAGPVFQQFQKVIEPIQPIIDLLDKRVPVLDTFGRKFLDVTGTEKDAPDGKVTLLDLVKLREPKAPLGFINAAKKASDFIKTIDELSKQDATIKLGQFDFGDFNVADPTFDRKAIDLEETSEQEEVVAQLKSLSPGLATFTNDITTPSGPQFPILTDPTQAFKLILGQPAELFKYNVPELRFNFRFEQFFPVIGPLGALIEGNLGTRVKLALGFDTYGLEQTGNPLDGFYIGNKPDPFGPGGLLNPSEGRESGAELFAGLNAAAAFSAGIARGGVGGGILGTLNLFLNDLNKDNDPTKVHLNEFDPSCIFDPVKGALSASLNAFIKIGFGFFSYTKRFNIAKATLLDFAVGCTPAERNNPARNNGLATLLPEGELRLNMGPDFAPFRLIGGKPGTDGAEVFAINYKSGAANDATLAVSAFDVTRDYSNVKRIVAFAGQEDDTIVIADAVFTSASLEGDEGNDQLYGGSGNDILKGEANDDALFGGKGDDNLSGGDGDDYLEGGAGADTLDGGSNNNRTEGGGDTVSYKDSPVGVQFRIDPSDSSFFVGSGGDAQGDRLKNIEQIEGSNFDDRLLGNNSSNTLEGLGGNDILEGGGEDDILLGGSGADLLDGGSGRDWTGYIASSAEVKINLETGEASSGDAEGDRLISIEDVKGSIHGDVLIGSDSSNHLDGFLGDDRIIGNGGADILDGGGIRSSEPNKNRPGNDWLSYKTSTSGVNVSLKTGGSVLEDPNNFFSVQLSRRGRGGDAEGDELVKAKDDKGNNTAYSSFENLEGSERNDSNDSLEGDIGDNIIKGLNGSDILKGDGGNDTLIGGAGADELDGGNGTDWADYSESPDFVDVDLTGTGTNADAEGDRFEKNNEISNVENLRGSKYGDTLSGDNGDNEINPGLSSGGIDTVDGRNNQDNDLLTLDYSFRDEGAGMTGGFDRGSISNGFFYRQRNENNNIRDDAVSFLNIERLKIIGTIQNDQIFGGARDDILLSGAGNDIIYGGFGSNTIYADDGDDEVVDQNDANRELNGSPNANSVIDLDGGRGIDALSIDLSAKSADIFLESTNAQQELNQKFESNGIKIVNFEVFKEIETGSGNDILTQLGRVNNNFITGAGDDIVNPGLGFDVVDGGSIDDSENVDHDLLILDYSTEDNGAGVRYSVVDPDTDTPTEISLKDLDTLSSLYANSGGYYYHRTSNGQSLDKIKFSNFERFNITGTSKDDILIGGDDRDSLDGGKGNDLLVGNGGSDQLAGGEGNDILIGLNSNLDFSDFGGGGIDTLAGGIGLDEFWLGDSKGVYYDDAADEDYAIIKDFNPSEDIIQLHGSAAEYSLFITPTSTAIYSGKFAIDQPPPELIAIIEKASLDLAANYFRFVDHDIETSNPVQNVNSLLAIEQANLITATPLKDNQNNSHAITVLNKFEVPNSVILSSENGNVSATALAQEASESIFELTQNNNSEQLLKNLLGDTVGLSNFEIELIGDGRAFGTFKNDAFGLGSGVAISTGRVIDLAGPNSEDGGFIQSNNQDLSQDFAEAGAAGDSISLKIEFDADATKEFLFFQYVFGSEEFVEFGGSPFNDNFSLRLNGFNFAKLSDAGTVSINNLVPSPLGPYHPDFIYNSVQGGSVSGETKLDGFTKPLLFQAPLVRNGRNTLEINVQDVGDGILDSAVLIRGGTVGTKLPITKTFDGRGKQNTISVNPGDGAIEINNFGGVGRGTNPSPATIAEVDTIKFTDPRLTPKNMLLIQNGSNLEIIFEGITNTKVILTNIALENLDNLRKETGASVNIGNILFAGQAEIQDSYDVLNAESHLNQIPNPNTVTFLNDLNNTIKGFSKSNDVINGQGGNDQIDGLSGDDWLRGGAGDDNLLGNNGDDILVGGVGRDNVIGGEGYDRFILEPNAGIDIITDFQDNQDQIGLVGIAFNQLVINQGVNTNKNDILISFNNGSNTELLAILTGVKSNLITQDDFVAV